MIKYIDYIYEIYNERSFTKAAEKLFVSQPALSLAIKKLEEEIGYPIFERRGKETIPTVYGEKYISAIKEIKRIQENLDNEIADMMNLRCGKLRIGSTTFISIYVLPEILKEYRNKYPNIDVELSMDQSTVLKDKLERGELDIIIDNAASICPELCYDPLFEENVFIGIPRDFKINESLKEYALSEHNILNGNFDVPRLDVALLKNEKFILLKEGNSMREITTEMFREANISPPISMEFDLLLTAVNYAEHGFGICAMTDKIIKNRNTNMILYSPNTRFAKRTVYIIKKKNKYIGAAADEFIKLTKSFIGE